RVARDRKHRLKRGMQSYRGSRFFSGVGLEELPVRVELDSQQVRRIENAGLLAKILADALLLGEGISHRVHLVKQLLRIGDTEALRASRHPECLAFSTLFRGLNIQPLCAT